MRGIPLKLTKRVPVLPARMDDSLNNAGSQAKMAGRQLRSSYEHVGGSDNIPRAVHATGGHLR